MTETSEQTPGLLDRTLRSLRRALGGPRHVPLKDAVAPELPDERVADLERFIRSFFDVDSSRACIFNSAS